MVQISTFVEGLSTLAATLNQGPTNGTSLFGTLDAQYPKFLTNNPLPHGYPWGLRTPYTDPITDSPHTGVVRYYDLTIERAYLAPDGVNKSMIVINGQFPGPLIEANWGDTISIMVHNRLTDPEDGTSIHWHGFLQTETPYYDGVPSVHQCPIAPGSDFTYTFKAELYGTSWYHSHYGPQHMDGAYGPVIIYGPSELDYDIDLGPVTLNDWFHVTSTNLIDAGFSIPEKISLPSNNLINGKMNYNCGRIFTNTSTLPNNCTSDADIAKFSFIAGKTHRIRLINSGAAINQKFTIDGHDLVIIANDFVPVKPYTTTVVTLGPGQRTDILVKANHRMATDAIWMRADLDLTCSPFETQPHALAAIYYPNAAPNARPNTTATGWSGASTDCGNDPLNLTMPLIQLTPPLTPAVTQYLDFTRERPDLIKERKIPYVIAQTCRDWATWSHTHVVDQIDSGL